MNNNKSVKHLTFGCRLNLLESETMMHYADSLDEDNLIIVNTCAVTKEAERQARQAVRKAHRENPEARIVVTGCASERDKDFWKSIPGVTKVISNHKKIDPNQWGVEKNTINYTPSRHTRALLQIQQGCDNDCTFCVIPQGRGRSKSFPYQELEPRIKTLLEDGHKEIVLTGVDLASWVDNGDKLGGLCKKILSSYPQIERLRLSSLDPYILIGENEDLELWDLIKNEPRLTSSIHLSMQAASEMILKRMKRRHTPQDLLQIIERLRKYRPNIGIGADLIAGFPTETEEYFEEGLKLIEKLKIPFLHVFPYSERPGTPADKMPPVPKKERQKRAKIIRETGLKAKEMFHRSFVGQTNTVLFETNNSGVTPEFCRFKLSNETAKNITVGSIHEVVISDANTDFLIGELS